MPATYYQEVILLPPSPMQTHHSTAVSRQPSMGVMPTSPRPPYMPGLSTIIMASPSPIATPHVPTVAMSSPTPSGSTPTDARMMPAGGEKNQTHL